MHERQHSEGEVRPRGSRSTSLLLPAVIAVVVGLLAVALLLRPGPDLERSRQKTGEQMANMLGLTRPVRNAIAAEYIDANHDLIADPPANAADQIDPPELTFSYVASDPNAAAYPAVFKPLTDALTRATGKPVRYVPLADVDAQAAAVHDGSLHVCAFNTGAVPDAVDAAGFVPVAVLGTGAGASTYTMLLLTAATGELTGTAKLKGQELVLTDPSSNSGAKAPLVMLNRECGFLPGRDFTIRWSGSHDRSIDGLAGGTYAAVAVASDVLARAERAGRIRPDQYRVIRRSDPFPTACFGYAHQLKPELAAKVRAALLGVSFENNALGEHFALSGQSRLVPTDYATDFRLVRELDDAVGYEHAVRRASAATQPSAAS